jgi:hypothetical protein
MSATPLRARVGKCRRGALEYPKNDIKFFLSNSTRIAETGFISRVRSSLQSLDDESDKEEQSTFGHFEPTLCDIDA